MPKKRPAPPRLRSRRATAPRPRRAAPSPKLEGSVLSRRSQSVERLRAELAACSVTLLQVERVAQQWRAAVDSSSDAILVLDAEGVILRVNRAAAAFLDRPFLSIVGRRPEELLPAALVRRLPGRDELLRAARRVEREVRLSGRRKWLALACDPVLAAADGTYRGCVISLQDISQRKAAEAVTQQLSEEHRRLAEHLETAREEERVSVAREIHDELGHALTALKLDLAWLARRLPAGQAELEERSTAMQALLDQTISAVRRLCTALRPGVLDDFGLLAALEWVTEQHGHRTGTATEFQCAVGEPPLPAPAATAVFRIVQEALTNVARHAEARHVVVAVTHRAPTALEVTVTDDGSGFAVGEARRHGGFGVLGMYERAASVGGELAVRSSRGHGTTVRLRLPVAALKEAR